MQCISKERLEGNKQFCDLGKTFVHMFTKKRRRKNLNHKLNKKVETKYWIATAVLNEVVISWRKCKKIMWLRIRREDQRRPGWRFLDVWQTVANPCSSCWDENTGKAHKNAARESKKGMENFQVWKILHVLWQFLSSLHHNFFLFLSC